MRRLNSAIVAIAASAAFLPLFAQAQEPLAAPPSSPLEGAVEAPIAEPSAEEKAVPAQEAGGYRSMMYTDDEVEALAPAIQVFRTRLRSGQSVEEEETMAPTVEGLEQVAPTEYEYPQFYLESALYHDPARWTVWVNGQKFTPDMPKNEAGLSIEGVSRQSVSFLWKPAAQTPAKWEAPASPGVQKDATARMVRFILQPNQTFSAYSMRILEGKFAPVKAAEMEEIDPAALLGGLISPTQQPGGILPPQPVPGNAEPGNTGLDGLINRYQNLNNPPH